MEVNVKQIPLASPDIRQVDIDRMVRVVQSGMLVQGKEVARFEQSIQEYLPTTHAICVTNGTATMHLALLALGIGPGDDVIVPAFSYMATANVVELVGAKPVFVDIRLESFNIDVKRIERAITPATKAILPVHEFGLCCDIQAIVEIGKQYSLDVIEDAACALGARDGQGLAGTFADLGSFSLHPRKAITSGEGGIVVTNRSELAERIRTLRNHGMNPNCVGMDFVQAGYNCRMTDFQAALVHSQFERLPQILAHKQQLADLYCSQIDNPRVVLPGHAASKQHSWQSFHILLAPSLNRDRAMASLREQGIGCNLGAQCMPAQTYFQKKYAHDCPREFPNAWQAYTQGLVLPLYEKLTADDIHYISEKVNQLR